jgi:hypothetical protein
MYRRYILDFYPDVPWDFQDTHLYIIRHFIARRFFLTDDEVERLIAACSFFIDENPEPLLSSQYFDAWQNVLVKHQLIPSVD